MDLRWHLQRVAATAGRKLLKWSGAYDGYWNHWRGDLFDRAEADGMHIMPVHYYSPVPKVAGLDPALWQPRDAATGIDLRLDESLQTLAEMADRFRHEFDEFAIEPSDPRTFHLHNNAYGPGDAESLYCFLRHRQPKRVIEIGCGYSTLVASIAQTRNREESPGESFQYTCVEPFLPDYLRPSPPGVTEVIEESVQSTPLSRFEELQAGDLLFIDSTHVVALGSDVVYEYLEILPRLRPGVLVHIHDIFLPNDYPRQWAEKSRFFLDRTIPAARILAVQRNVPGDPAAARPVHPAEGGAAVDPPVAETVRCPRRILDRETLNGGSRAHRSVMETFLCE